MARAPKTTTAEAPNLQQQVIAKRAELIETQRSHAAGELVNPRALPRIRKEIARLLTEINRPSDIQASQEEETK